MKDPAPLYVPIEGGSAAIRFLPAARQSSWSILALHGFTGSGEDFLPLAQALGYPDQSDYHWILPDWMGHGDSSSPENLRPYSLPAAIELIDQARKLAPNPEKLFLIAYSMGARIALAYLKQAQPLPACLISGSPGLATLPERNARLKADAKWIAMLEGQSMETFSSAWEAQPVIAPQTQLPEPKRSKLAARRRQNNAVGLSRSLQACGTGSLPSLWECLPQMPPIHLVFGEKDRKFSQIARQMADINPQFQLRSFPYEGHAIHLENPDALAAIFPLMIHQSSE